MTGSGIERCFKGSYTPGGSEATMTPEVSSNSESAVLAAYPVKNQWNGAMYDTAGNQLSINGVLSGADATSDQGPGSCSAQVFSLLVGVREPTQPRRVPSGSDQAIHPNRCPWEPCHAGSGAVQSLEGRACCAKPTLLDSWRHPAVLAWRSKFPRIPVRLLPM